MIGCSYLRVLNQNIPELESRLIEFDGNFVLTNFTNNFLIKLPTSKH